MSHPESKLMLVGDGPLREEIEKMVRERKLVNSVIFAGAQIDTAPFYSAFDLFLVPSLWEGLSIVTVEAQASGLPIVAADTLPEEVNISGDIRYLSLDDTIDTWNGSIETALSRGLSDRKKKGSMLLGSAFDLENLAQTMRNVYGELCRQS